MRFWAVLFTFDFAAKHETLKHLLPHYWFGLTQRNQQREASCRAFLSSTDGRHDSSAFVAKARRVASLLDVEKDKGEAVALAQ